MITSLHIESMHRTKVQNWTRKSGGGKLCLSRGQCKARLVTHLPSKGNNRCVYPVASPHLSLQSSGTIHPQNNVWIVRCRAKRYLKSDYKVKTSGWQAGVRPRSAPTQISSSPSYGTNAGVSEPSPVLVIDPDQYFHNKGSKHECNVHPRPLLMGV